MPRILLHLVLLIIFGLVSACTTSPARSVQYKDCWDGASLPVSDRCPQELIEALEYKVLTWGGGDNYAGDNHDYVHNVDLKGVARNSAGLLAVEAEKPVSLEYWIGREIFAEDYTTEVAPALAAELTQAELSETDFLIEAQFICSICNWRDNQNVRMPIRFDAEQARTTPIQFAFTPTLDDPDFTQVDGQYQPGVTVVLWECGRRLDEFHVPISVASNMDSNEQGAEEAEFSDTWTKTGLDQSRNHETPPDIELKIEDTRAGAVITSVRICNEELVEEVNAQLVANSALFRVSLGQSVSSDTRLASVGELLERLVDTYIELSCLTMPMTASNKMYREAFEERISRRNCHRTLSLGRKWSSRRAEAKIANEEIYRIGSSLYSELFSLNSDARRLMTILAEITHAKIASNNPPLRLRIFSPVARIPTQLLHPPLDADAVNPTSTSSPRYFGLIFDIADIHIAPGYENDVSNDNEYAQESAVIAGYRGGLPSSVSFGEDCDRSWDQVAYQSCRHYQAVKDILTNNRNVRSEAPQALRGEGRRPGYLVEPAAVSAEAFIESLEANAAQARLIWGYLHGKTRYDEEDFSPIKSAEARIMFSTNGFDQFRPRYLRRLVGASSARLFKARPIVGFIACETGAPVIGGTSGRTFTNAFLRAGAQGVITSEAEVDSKTADIFGQRFLRYVFGEEGHQPSYAMFLTRRAIYEEYGGNLWPLLFNYTGGH